MVDPILLNFPDSFQSQRLIICSPMPGDGKPLYDAIVESWESLRQWMPWAVEQYDEQWYEKRVRQQRLDFLAREDLSMMLIMKDSQQIVGRCGLHCLNWNVPKFEIGYWVRMSYSGRGLITEAVSAVTEFTFDLLGAKRVEIRCDSRNERSAAVARRAGYPLEGILHNEDRHHLTNALRHTLVFAKTRS